MGASTGIEWTDATWNPWYGCHKVSQGCKRCYMFSGMKRYGRDPNVVRRAKPTTFYAPLKWKDARKVFTCSWSDFLIEEADSWRSEALSIMQRTQHTYQVLSKRIERLLDGKLAWVNAPNVWLGTSVEDRKTLRRIDHLRAAPAAVRFLSIEPLLEDLGEIDLAGIDWVIVGGESGPMARPMQPEWARSIRDQCLSAGVSFFFKQWGGLIAKAGGRLLDGREWNELPVISHALL